MPRYNSVFSVSRSLRQFNLQSIAYFKIVDDKQLNSYLFMLIKFVKSITKNNANKKIIPFWYLQDNTEMAYLNHTRQAP
ncbi:hypothetical protein DDO72_07395 [Vibrio cholerae]|nr:hypothetical protein [Vibrio cholerae]